MNKSEKTDVQINISIPRAWRDQLNNLAHCDPAIYLEPQSDNYFMLISPPYKATVTFKSAVPAN